MDGWARRDRILTWALIAAAVLYSIYLRWVAIAAAPLWFDESWTAILSSSTSFADFLHQAWLDASAPFYSLVMWVWPFESDVGLRIPGLLFGLGAAAVAALGRLPGVPREAMWMWGAAVLLWTPGIALLIDARCYGLLLLLSTLQAILFARLLDQATIRNALRWVGVSTLCCLTHYYAALPALVQGLVYLAVQRRRAVRTWPSLFLLFPLLAWFPYHWPRLMEYAAPGTAWYKLIQGRDLVSYGSWPLANAWQIAAMLVLIAVIFRRPVPRSVGLVAISGMLSLLLYIGLGALRPILTERYLLPVVPSILLGFCAMLRPVAYLPVTALWVMLFPTASSLQEHLVRRSWFGAEMPARYLPEADVVSWDVDYPGARILDRDQMDRILSDALRRNGRSAEVRYGLGAEPFVWLYSKAHEPVARSIASKRRCKILPGGFTDWGTLVCGASETGAARQ